MRREFAKVWVAACAALVNVFSTLNVGGFDQMAAKLGGRTDSTIDFQRYVLPVIAPGGGDLPYNYDVFDIELAALVGVLLLGGALLCRGSRWKRVVRPLELAALTLLPVTAEVYLFDYSEFFAHVTQLQVRLNFAIWFSNADLFDACLLFLLLAGAGELLAWSTSRPWRSVV